MFSIPTLIEKKKPEVLVKNEFEYREKIKSKSFSLEVSDYRNTDAREKNNELLVENQLRSAGFLLEILRDKIELVAAESLKFEKRANSKLKALFRKFGRSTICCMDQNKNFVT